MPFLLRKMFIMLLLGFSAGLPILLIFSSLSVWLRDAGVSRTMVTYFSWAALGYSFKFVWAPLVDQLKIPLIGRWLGQRRSWLLLSQLMVIIAIWVMASTDPINADNGLVLMAVGAVLLGFSSATQDIVIDAFRIESADPKFQALLSSTYIAGYRIAMILAGAGALYLASYFGSTEGQYVFTAWSQAYKIISAAMVVGILTTLSVREPVREHAIALNKSESTQLVLMFILCVAVFVSCYVYSASVASIFKTGLTELFANTALSGVVVEFGRLSLAISGAWICAKVLTTSGAIDKKIVTTSYIVPIQDFFSRYGMTSAWVLLGLIGLYRISDIVLGVISTVFYVDIGFTKNQIASVSKIFGVVMSIVGGFAGGILAFKFGVMRILLVGAILSAASNLLFMWLATIGPQLEMLVLVISIDNLSAGLASAAFVAFLSALTSVRFTATQFAIFTSLMTLLPKTLGGYSGSMVDTIGYSSFFIFTALIGLPVIGLILWANHRFDIELPDKEKAET